MISGKMKNRFLQLIYPMAESIFRRIERAEFSRGSGLFRIPPRSMRGGGLGTTSYGEWCYTVGQFQTLIGLNITERPLKVLDVGCGVGRLYIATRPFLTSHDRYIGIDITKKSIEICNSLFRSSGVEFIHTPASNAFYSGSDIQKAQWPIEDESMTLVTGLSVWTHLNEQDCRHYLGEVARVLRPKSRAIITFFILDELYRPHEKTERISNFYPQPQNKWVFDTPAYGSSCWRHPAWTSVPETAIGIENDAFAGTIESSGLKLLKIYPGQWKEFPGLFFQDIAILEKT